MVIYLGLTSPSGSSDLPESRRAALCFLFGLASNGVYICPVCCQTGGSLLHCPSTLTIITNSGIFLLHCPWSHLHRPLAGILPCEARTFLACGLSAPAAAVIRPTCLSLHSLTYLAREYNYFYTLKQLPPINSRKIEFFPISSLGTGRK